MQNFIKKIIDFSDKQKQPKGFKKEEFLKFIEIFYSQNQTRDFDNYSIEDIYNDVVLTFGFFNQINK